MARPPKDTIRFEAPARAHHCSGGPRSGLVLQGSSDGNGVFIWLRGGETDSLAGGPWPLLQRGDTLSPRGGTVGVRYMLNAVAHGLPLDSGAVEVRETAHVFTVVARGTGHETMAAGRVALEASFDAVPLETDSVSCWPRP
ncbi:MAG: hypothetical protein DMD25_02615 [Gemmatimonadetes bacterium]|nr:MAG: hypothetical protein DMD25_02615 [Gemmatimonadota bacterium]